MATATTTLPLFWNLASANKSERIDASAKLITALQQFQEQHKAVQKEKEPTPSEPEEDEEQNEESGDEANEEDSELKSYSAKLDSDNAPDVAYAIRRLLRGLASPRESSRLGFAVGFTELLSRIDTVTCEQVFVLLRSFSRTSGSMSGQEERDILFARLFGLKSIVQSGILFDQRSLRLSSKSLSSLKGFETFLTELLELGEKKSWLRESCWRTLLSAIDALYSATVPWKEDAYAILLERVYVNDKSWSPEKVALTLRLQKARPDADWKTHCDSYFKGSDILSTTNLSLLGRLLKTSASEGMLEEDTTKHSTGPWKPQLHFVWDVVLDMLLNGKKFASTRSFQDFYQVVVDEMLFSSSSSPQRKYWGFLAFQKVLHRVPKEHLPLLFTKNFMRTWINQLSKNDRYLHKIALQVLASKAADVQHIVENDPKAGFTLVLQLTGANGSYQFDRLTKTKTVENILSNTDNSGIKEFIDYLFQQVNEGEQDDALASVHARRSWIIEQLATITRKRSIPKTDENLQAILEWLATHSFFNVYNKSSKSSNAALFRVPVPPFSEELRKTCRTKLLSCLGDLTSSSTSPEKSEATKTVKLPGVASDGEFWISKVLKTILDLEQNRKHVISVHHLEDTDFKTRKRALSLIEKIEARRTDGEVVRGAELLLSALTLRCLCETETDWEEVQECTKQFTRLFAPVEPSEKKKMKEKEPASEDDGERPPVDLVVDIIIGLLEQSTNFTRIVANVSFSMLSSLVASSTVDLILAQLERRDPTEETMEDNIESTGSDVSSESGLVGEDDHESQDETSSASSSEEVADEEETEALRKALQAAVSGKYSDSDGGKSKTSSDEESMDDEQMMAIDEKIAAVFQLKAQKRRKGKDAGAQREATYFKNRVLDLVEIYMKRQPSNPLFLRFVLPLIELVATASSDEMQLSDKAKGILRSRLSKTNDAIPIDDASRTTELLESLHRRARRTHSQEVVSVISICSLFVSKALIASDEEAVLKIYKESASDFITRKASSLNASFVTDFIRRHPLLAWNIRSHIAGILNEAANGFRQTQAFGILHIMYTSLPQPESRKDEIMSFAAETSKAFLEAMNKSCMGERPLTNSAQTKQLLKTALAICRFIRRYAAGSELEEVWVPEEWGKLASNLASSENFKVATSLPNTCRQISKLIRNDDGNSRGTAKNAGRKRKQEAEEQSTQVDGSGSRKPKRKKVRKATKFSDSRPTV